MTVCLGVVCADSNGAHSSAVVVASDRMVTLGGLTEFEHGVPKATKVAERVIALIAGDALRGSRIVREVGAHYGQIVMNSGTHPTTREIAEAVARKYADLRLAQLDEEVFRPRSITIQEFYQGQQTKMVPQLAMTVDQHVVKFNFGVDILIAGVDAQGGHLFHAGNPGGAFSDAHPIGFAAIGSGALHALQSLIGFSHIGSCTLAEAIFRVYASKRRAEAAPGVGQDTDIIIVHGGGTYSWVTTASGSWKRRIRTTSAPWPRN